MILYPAIDLKDGCCVRLRQGDMRAATIYGRDPAAQARDFARVGCQWLHVVDLDAATTGTPGNAAAVAAILGAVDLPVQFGGGVRDRSAIDHWLEVGVARVVLGTIAVRDPELVRTAARADPGRIAVALDVRDGNVAVEGWTENTQVSAVELARRLEDAGVAALVHTDIGRDGLLAGPATAESAALAAATSVPVIVSGGVAALGDLTALAAMEGVFDGVIVGRALYDGRMDPAAALRALAGHHA